MVSLSLSLFDPGSLPLLKRDIADRGWCVISLQLR